MKKLVVKQSGLVVAMTLVLTACGGGGSSSTPSNTNAPSTNNASPSTQTPAVPPTTTATTAPNTAPATHTGTTVAPVNDSTTITTTPTNTSKETAISVLNTQRSTCGFSALQDNSELTKASQNHNKYMAHISETTAVSQIFASHYELAEVGWKNSHTANPYFSGESVNTRIKTGNNKGASAVAVNYPVATSYNFTQDGKPYIMYGSFVAENIATSTTDTDVELLRNLLAAPYHLKSLVSQYYKDVGIHYHGSNKWTIKGYNPISANYLTLVLGLQQNQAPSFSSSTLSYPCAGITGVAHTLTDETPDPFVNHPSRKGISKENPIGQPVYIVAPNSKEISNISNVSFKAVNGSISPQVWVMFNNAKPNTNINQMIDVHKRLENNEAFLIPNEALKPATTYEVSYTLTYKDGSNENSKFRFSTKS